MRVFTYFTIFGDFQVCTDPPGMSKTWFSRFRGYDDVRYVKLCTHWNRCFHLKSTFWTSWEANIEDNALAFPKPPKVPGFKAFPHAPRPWPDPWGRVLRPRALGEGVSPRMAFYPPGRPPETSRTPWMPPGGPRGGSQEVKTHLFSLFWPFWGPRDPLLGVNRVYISVKPSQYHISHTRIGRLPASRRVWGLYRLR